jgi:hypothetical protein
MSSKNRDEILSRFIAITQCSSKEAAEYLENANWNEQTAVDFFFDSGRSQVPDPIPSPKIKTNQNIPSLYLFIYLFTMVTQTVGVYL